MILASGAGGPGFNSRSAPYFTLMRCWCLIACTSKMPTYFPIVSLIYPIKKKRKSKKTNLYLLYHATIYNIRLH